MTILTDDERPKLPPPRRIRGDAMAYSARDMNGYADEREAAVLAKLAQQAPVAEIEVNAAPAGGVTATVWSVHLAPGTYSLHLHPAPQQADHPRVREGWKLVPVEPTCDMLAAMSGEWHPSRHGKAREQYAAMLAAAPEAPAQEKACSLCGKNYKASKTTEGCLKCAPGLVVDEGEFRKCCKNTT